MHTLPKFLIYPHFPVPGTLSSPVGDLRDVPKPDVLDDADLMVQDPSLGMSSPGKGPRGPKKAAQLHTAMMLSNGGAPEQPYRQTYTELSQKRAQCRCVRGGARAW